MATREDENAQVRVVATDFLRLRPVIVVPFLAFTVALLVLSGAPRPQVVALGCAATLFATFFLHERRVGRQRVVHERTFFRSLVATTLGIAVGTTATGAIVSPLLPMLFAPVGVGFAAFGRTRRSAALLGLLGAIVALLFVVTPLVRGLAVAEPWRWAILGAAVVDAALLLRVGVASLAEAHRRAAETLALAGDEVIRAAQSRTRSLETLSAKVAHEVKNPLAAIRAIVEVMLESGDERAKKRLTVVAGEIARIEQILDGYGSLAHPLEVVRREPTDVTALVHDLVVVLEARAAQRGIVLALDTPATPLAFALDRDRVKEALLNLVLNALEVTPPGGAVTVVCAQAGEMLELRVVDTGKGMDAETLAKVGTPFFTRREGGTGLGVALARQVAEQHGGTLSYASTPGVGTTAVLQILREEQHAPNRPDL